VEGTLNVLNAALEKGCKKVVVTSSCLAIFFGNEDKLLTEEDWSDPTKCSHYPKSTVIAEKAVWEFYDKNKDKIDVTVVNPSMVLGPIYTVHGNASESLLAEIMRNNYPGIPDPEMTPSVVDVRDAAEAHVRALFNPISTGKRYIISGSALPYSKFMSVLKEEFGKYGYIIPDKKVTAQQIKESGNAVAQRGLPLIGKVMNLNNERGVKELGMKYKPVEETIKDMGYSLIKLGVVENKISN